MTDSLINWDEQELSTSVYKNYAPPCSLCRKQMDHPPIKVMISRPSLSKGPKNGQPLFEGAYHFVCRWCILEAFAPISPEDANNPRAGWLHRAILRGELEPAGGAASSTRGVDEEVGPTPKT